jgi:PAS domain S-box-containing protein
MKDGKKAKKQLTDELVEIRQRAAELETAEAKRGRAEDAVQWSGAWLPTASLFFVLCVLVWLNEVLDFPHLLLGAPRTPVNWQEATIEALLVAIVGLFTVSKLIYDIAKRKQAEEELREYRDHLEELVKERTTKLTTANEQLQKEITERKRAEEALRQRNRELALLNQVGQVLSSTLELDQVLAAILERVCHLLGVVASSIWLVDPETDELVCRQATGPKSEIVCGWRLALGEGLAGWVARHGQGLIVPDARADERYFQGVDQQTGLNVQSILSVPLKIKREVIGVLQMVDTEAARFSERDLGLLESLAAPAAISLENARLYERAQQEIVERKQAEEALAESESRLRSVLVSMDDLVFVFDRQSRFTLYYAPTKELYVPQKEFLEKKHAEVMPPEVDRLFAQAFNKNKTGEVAEYEYQLEIGGETKWYSAKLSPMFLHDEFAGSVAVVRNVTDRRQAGEALRQYTVELEARNEELDAFAHTVAHDLKNPLGLCIGYAQVLEQDYPTMPDEELRDALRYIARTALRMSDIIDELLLLAKLRQAEVATSLLDMAGIVAEAQQRLADMIKQQQAEIVSPETWPMALGYGPWIEQVWVNYLSNAIKYGGQPSRIELGATTQPDGTVLFWIRDNGPGLKPEEQARLFTPLTQLDKVQAKGHGLGLSIVRRIVEKLGGQVGVESEVGQGSTFTFTLPGMASAQ